MTDKQKMRNYRAGAVKRRLKVPKGEPTPPGSLISKMNAEKIAMLGSI